MTTVFKHLVYACMVPLLYACIVATGLAIVGIDVLIDSAHRSVLLFCSVCSIAAVYLSRRKLSRYTTAIAVASLPIWVILLWNANMYLIILLTGEGP